MEIAHKYLPNLEDVIRKTKNTLRIQKKRDGILHMCKLICNMEE